MRNSAGIVQRGACLLLACAAGLGAAGSAAAQHADLAKQLNNPVASLISVPFQLNYDEGYGPSDGHRTYVNLQPVVPLALNADWNLISRTILPVIGQDDIAGPSGSQLGLGDITQSLFFSPKNPGPGGIIWGAGPVLLIPTATDDLLGGKKWGAGPTAVALRQTGPWTYGMLANHVWSFAGADDRTDISSTFVQPFLSYTTPTAWSFTANTESSYDWKAEQWSVPLNAMVSKVVQVGARPVSFGGGLRYWAESPENGPEGFGLRAVVTLLFPR
jgi:hypothetical protein